MGFIKATTVNNLRAKFFGKGNRYFLASQSQWAATPKGGKESDESNYLGVYHILQNALYTQTLDYLKVMQDVAEALYASYNIEPLFESDMPIPDNFFTEMQSHGQHIVGTFGNRSDHARYVEWGTGPVGSRNSGTLSDTAKELAGPITYRESPWTYFNTAVGHFVRTEGMAPRPFVYPAFLRMKGAYVASLAQICKHLYAINWSAGTFPDHRGARGVNEGKGGRHGI